MEKFPYLEYTITFATSSSGRIGFSTANNSFFTEIVYVVLPRNYFHTLVHFPVKFIVQKLKRVFRFKLLFPPSFYIQLPYGFGIYSESESFSLQPDVVRPEWRVPREGGCAVRTGAQGQRGRGVALRRLLSLLFKSQRSESADIRGEISIYLMYLPYKFRNCFQGGEDGYICRTRDSRAWGIHVRVPHLLLRPLLERGPLARGQWDDQCAGECQEWGAFRVALLDPTQVVSVRARTRLGKWRLPRRVGSARGGVCRWRIAGNPVPIG